jgi:beta-lactamase class A
MVSILERNPAAPCRAREKFIKERLYQMSILRLALLIAFFVSSVLAAPSDSGLAAVQTEIQRIASGAVGEVGVAAWRLDGRGPRVLLNADDAFPMASTFKVAVAGALLAKVDAGTPTLETMLQVDQARHVESDVIANALIHPGVSLSVHNLLELMLTHSDNTATDVLTATAGGPASVTAWVRGQGITGLRVDRDTAGIVRDFFGLPAGTFSEALAIARKADPKLDERGNHPNATFDKDPRDSSTPNAMAELLSKIFTGHALSSATTKEIIGIMERCHTGNDRLRGRLPATTTVADKTGTLGGSVNDVGVITLPNGKGQVVCAVFIKKSELPFADREKVIADIARAVYDYFLFASEATSK